MEKEDFFAKLDTTLGKTKEAEVSRRDATDDNQLLLEEVVARLQPMIATYKTRLAERKIHAEVISNSVSISFTLRYADGGHYGVSIGQNFKNNRIEITSRFTNDDGKDYTGTSGLTYDRSNWKDSIFEDALQKCINDFLFYANRHGGIRHDGEGK